MNTRYTVFSALIFGLLVTTVIPLQIFGANQTLTLDLGPGNDSLQFNLSRGDILTDHSQEKVPTKRSITYQFTLKVTGDAKDPQDQSKSATVSLSSKSSAAFRNCGAPYITFSPSSGRLPLTSTATMAISREMASKCGVDITALVAGGLAVTRSISLEATRDQMKMVVTKPQEGEIVTRPGVVVEGYVEPRIPGVIVYVDIYHKRPEFDTYDKLNGQGSGIVGEGLTITDDKGNFKILNTDPVFTFGFGYSSILANIDQGRYWLLYRSAGQAIFEKSLEKAKPNNVSTIDRGISTFKPTEYTVLYPSSDVADYIPNPNQLVSFQLAGGPQLAENACSSRRFCITTPRYVESLEAQSDNFKIYDNQPDETPNPVKARWNFSITVQGQKKEIGSFEHLARLSAPIAGSPQNLIMRLGKDQYTINPGSSPITAAFTLFPAWSELVRQYGGPDEDFQKNNPGSSLLQGADRVLKIDAKADLLDKNGQVIESSNTQSFSYVLMPPVIFVHGIGGARLLVDGVEAWPKGYDNVTWGFGTTVLGNLLGNKNFLDLSMQADGKTNVNNKQVKVGGLAEYFTHGVGDIYGSYVDFMKGLGYDPQDSKTGFYEFNYDWRQDNRVHADALANLVSKVRQEHHNDKVIIMAHSMGGLVTRYYTVKHPEYTRDIEAFIFMATPHNGSPRAYQAVALDGYNFGNPLLSDKTGKRLSTNLPSAYQLLPSYPFITDVTDPANPKKLSLEEVYLSNYQFAKLIPNTDLIKEAMKFHQEIGDQAPPGVPSINIMGVDISTTLVALDVKQKAVGNQDYLFMMPDINSAAKIENGAGDGTVPLISAELRGATQFYVKAGHMNVPGAAQTQRILQQLLMGDIPAQGQQFSLPSSVLKLRLNSHSTLQVYDADGNHVGRNPSGLIDENIPGSEYLEFGGAQYVLLSDPQSSFRPYRVEILGESKGTFTLTTEVVAGSKYIKSTYQDVPIDNKVNATLKISGGAPSLAMNVTGGRTVTPEVQSASVPSSISLGTQPTRQISTVIQTSPLSIFFPMSSDLKDIVQEAIAKPQETSSTLPSKILDQPMLLLIPSVIWLVIALILGLLLRSGKLSLLITVLVLGAAAYFTTAPNLGSANLDTVTLLLKTAPLLPAIIIGAPVGGFIGRRFRGSKSKQSKEQPKT